MNQTAMTQANGITVSSKRKLEENHSPAKSTDSKSIPASQPSSASAVHANSNGIASHKNNGTTHSRDEVVKVHQPAKKHQKTAAFQQFDPELEEAQNNKSQYGQDGMNYYGIIR